jgi:hypothetical protein
VSAPLPYHFVQTRIKIFSKGASSGDWDRRDVFSDLYDMADLARAYSESQVKGNFPSVTIPSVPISRRSANL